MAKEDALKQLGVDEVIVYCVNDGAVMAAWSEDQGVPTDSIIKLMGDPYAILTEKLDLELTHAGPKSVGLINRCKRHALYVVDGKVEIVRVAEKEDDPAGMFLYFVSISHKNRSKYKYYHDRHYFSPKYHDHYFCSFLFSIFFRR